MGNTERNGNPLLSFWLARDSDGYILGRGDQEIARGLDHASAHVLVKAPAMLEALRKIAKAKERGLAFEHVQGMAQGMVEAIEVLAFQQDDKHQDAIQN